jgi:hypothetical protein
MRMLKRTTTAIMISKLTAMPNILTRACTGAALHFVGAQKMSAGFSRRKRGRVSGKRHHVVERQVDDIGRH